jgi:hypothetical protein
MGAFLVTQLHRDMAEDGIIALAIAIAASSCFPK